mmetsp:Transcript_45462/g.125493  ORF Transcript_45462/g.125493 Transcript_45462/m.125493 type:complete len:466 (+) Transcript_45462:127-1524(+)|eukprot:CAMPEP_0119544104 /NCGR_PEP_ID=MMETSP1344-20130328/54527_1 /TAXON_ID=236787 /ORGANISM="Florenciella parvula, Strain CCMP2471" /LENGTH=465 /DNA_ID=CAMNT_0007588557 /DNA_START=127 /DNA_END=1524 /DNA_ORIENTATION=+
MEDRGLVATPKFGRRFAAMLVVALALLPSQVSSGTCGSGTEQYSALSALYTEIGGADSSWNNWMSGDPCDDYWYGITTSDDSVTQVALTGMSSATSAATLPTQLGYLTDLKTGLELSSNSFVGTIPTQFGKLTNMQSCGKACFYNNELTGTLPSQLGQWTKLTAADGLFAENSITGTVPSELGKWAELDSCGKGCLSDNQISGTIPTQLGQWGRNFSAGFAFDNNKMTGSLPTQIGYLTSMTSELLLEGNSFTGSLPTELGLVVKSFDQADTDSTSDSTYDTAGDYLRLAGNSFCGSVPDEIQDNWPSDAVNSNICSENYFGYSCADLTVVETGYDSSFCDSVDEALCYETADGDADYTTGSHVCPDDDDGISISAGVLVWIIVGPILGCCGLCCICACIFFAVKGCNQNKPPAGPGGAHAPVPTVPGSNAPPPQGAVQMTNQPPMATAVVVQATVVKGAGESTI